MQICSELKPTNLSKSQRADRNIYRVCVLVHSINTHVALGQLTVQLPLSMSSRVTYLGSGLGEARERNSVSQTSYKRREREPCVNVQECESNAGVGRILKRKKYVSRLT